MMNTLSGHARCDLKMRRRQRGSNPRPKLGKLEVKTLKTLELAALSRFRAALNWKMDGK
jgi:hypothetical protein